MVVRARVVVLASGWVVMRELGCVVMRELGCVEMHELGCVVMRDLGCVATGAYTHLRAHETVLDLVCRLLLEKKNHP